MVNPTLQHILDCSCWKYMQHESHVVFLRSSTRCMQGPRVIVRCWPGSRPKVIRHGLVIFERVLCDAHQAEHVMVVYVWVKWREIAWSAMAQGELPFCVTCDTRIAAFDMMRFTAPCYWNDWWSAAMSSTFMFVKNVDCWLGMECVRWRGSQQW